jgi:hypothetical protein
MPIRELMTVHNPTLGIYRRAFSTAYGHFGRNVLMSVDRRYSECWGATLGALYDSDGDLIAASVRDGGRRGDLVVCVDPPRLIARQALRIDRHLAGRTLYLGQFMMHYGHFLVETMARFWSVGLGSYDHFAFFPFRPEGAPAAFLEFQTIFLEKFQIPTAKITILEAPTSFEEIHVPEQLCTINHRANIHMANIYRHIAAPYVQDRGNRRIFLSRLQPFERVANVTAVEAVFRDLDFEIVYPETLDLHAQIALYANCGVMAGLGGSALHNCLFSREGIALIELGDIRSRTQPVPTQEVVNQAAGVEDHFVVYEGTPAGEMDTVKLRRTLLELPLLGRSVPPHQRTSDFHAHSLANHYPWPGTLTAHVSNVGDVVKAGGLEIGGDRAGRSAIEGFSIALDRAAPFGLEYKALLPDGTWTGWRAPGTFVGSRGQAQPLRGYAVRLDDAARGRFRCVCLGRFEGQDGVVAAADGTDCTASGGGRMMGMQLQLRRA